MLGKIEISSLSLHSQNTEVVAQSVRASDCGSEGRGFEPHHPPSHKESKIKIKSAFYSPIFFPFILFHLKSQRYSLGFFILGLTSQAYPEAVIHCL